MSKYDALWAWIKKQKDGFKLTFVEIEQIAGFPIGHSFLTYKKGINELWVSGRQNLDERADGYVSEAGKFRFSGEQQIFIYG